MEKMRASEMAQEVEVLAANLRTWDRPQERTWWKDRTSSTQLSSENHKWVRAGVQTSVYTRTTTIITITVRIMLN